MNNFLTNASRRLRYAEDPDRPRDRSGSSEYLRHRLAFGLFALLSIIGCSDNDPDRFLVHSERTRFGVLDDPSTLTTASAPPLIESGKWNGPTTEQANAVPATQPALKLTIQQAVLMALDRNRDLVVQRSTRRLPGTPNRGCTASSIRC